MEFIDFDIRGQICPSTLLIALREVNEQQRGLRTGTVGLRFLTDNRDCTVTIPEAVGSMGYEAMVHKSDGHYVVAISKAGQAG